MSFLKKLFGGSGGAAQDAEPQKGESYKDFVIHVAPIKEAQGYRVAARIEKEIDGTLKTHQLIRADVISSQDEARSTTLLKAKALIDQMGDHLF